MYLKNDLYFCNKINSSASENAVFLWNALIPKKKSGALIS